MLDGIGYVFRNESLLDEALTTPSYRMDFPDAKDYQRLEFLGDSILGFLAAEHLYGVFPEEHEGPLTVRRTHLVSASALCRAAARTDLVANLKRNRGAEALDPNSKIIADAVEAVIGAAYIDGGLDAARAVFAALALAEGDDQPEWIDNPKGELQVRSQAMKPPRHPDYELVNVEGKAHEPVFTVRVTVDGIGSATAKAKTRREADAAAATELLKRMS